MKDRRFTSQDQERFALLSGDRNPIHVDAVAARRLLAGAQVVHGVHTLLSAVEHAAGSSDLVIAALTCQFVNAVAVGDQVRFATDDEVHAGRVSVTASVGDLLCTKLALLADNESVIDRPSPSAAGDMIAAPVTLELPTVPLDRPTDSWVSNAYAIRLVQQSFVEDFPASCRALGHDHVRALATISSFVGMVCPGLHSLLSSIAVSVDGSDADSSEELVFRVTRFDSRVNLMTIAVTGRVNGQIRAFVRPPPQAQPAIQDLLPIVGHKEFSGKRALVLGGSRGLGELTAKLVAAGGGDVVITYSSGLHDANRVASEISKGGRGQCTVSKWALGESDIESVLDSQPALDAVFYFPTPRIFRRSQRPFDPAIFHEFVTCYVNEFANLCERLDRRQAESPIRVFFPSTVAVADRPRGLAEYAMAKAAAEELARDLNMVLKSVRIIQSRLPRVSTDQTSTLLNVPSVSGISVMLPIVRDVMG